MLRRDWTVIDKKASQATDKDAQTFDKLIKFLEEPVKNNPDRDIYMTRGLMYWLKCNAHRKDDHGKDSPLTLAANMFSGKMAYADAFSELCQKANIQCETVSGIAKTGEYQPGDLEIDKEKMHAYWNKVYLLGKWWPTHPRYVLRTVKGTTQPTGSTASASTSQTAGNQDAEITFNDFWFLTSPEIFLNKCYPDKAEDQMLPASKHLKRSRQFMKLPYLTPVFHENNLKLTSDEMCIIDSIDGQARISFKGERATVKDMMCSYTIGIQNRDGSDMKNIDFDTSRLVFSSRKKNQFIFEVRCPVEGNFQLAISGGKIESKTNKILLKCKIVCRERIPVFHPLPIDAGQLGWGFGPTAVRAGLSKPKVKEPKVFIQPKSSKKSKTTVKMRFAVAKETASKTKYDAELRVEGKTASDFKGCISVKTRSSELQVDLSVPGEGEYALVIKAKGQSDSEFKPVCNYLLTTLEDEERMCDDYYDSSDGTSDIDEEIDQLETTLKAMTAERDGLKQQATDKDAQTFDKLIKFLEEPVKNNPDRDIYMTRGLMYWLKCNAHRKDDHGKDSPLTLAANMFSGKMAYADAFSELCQKANIQCETVSGIAKTGEYQPGDLEIDKEKMHAYWNKVYLLGKWWPTHPRYVLRTVKGTTQPTGSTASASTSQTAGNQDAEITFNDFWFLTSPEIFLNKCYPDKAEDQMLPASKHLKRSRQFMKLPYLTPVFHENNLKLTSDEMCIIDSIDGQARISFKGERATVKDMMCSYTIGIQNRDGSDMKNIDFDTSRLVFSSRKKNQFIFEVRCPVEGNFQLAISGGKIESKTNKILLKCKIVCRERIPVFHPLPIDAGQLGWGFGPTAVRAGLSKPKVKEPKVFIQPKSSKKSKTTVKMRFAVAKETASKTKYDAELRVEGKTASDFKGCISVKTTSSELQVDLSVPGEGEYALVIKAKGQSDSEFKPVCNYLLTTLEDEERMCDDYYDSSDGTSDIDEEIDQLETTLKAMTAERDGLKQQVSRQ